MQRIDCGRSAEQREVHCAQLTPLRAFLLLLALSITAMSCSAVLDFDECSSNSDCDGDLVCSEEGYCVTLASSYTGPVLKSEECQAAWLPQDAENELEDLVFIGTILPVSGPNSAIGLPIEQAVKLAVDDFNSRGGVGDAGRKLGLVLCDSSGDVTRGVAAARHLKSIGVPAVVGPAFSDVTLAVGKEVAPPDTDDNPHGLVLISPSSTNPSISDLDSEAKGHDHVWRTTPSDTLQAFAMSVMLNNPSIYGLPTEPRLMVLYKEGPYGEGLTNALQQALEEAGAEAGAAIMPEVVAYPDPDAQVGAAWDFAPAHAKIEAFRPNVVVLIGTNEATEILAWVEYLSGGWDEPIEWIMSEGGKLDSLFSAVEKADYGLDPSNVFSRLRGTGPGAIDGATYSIFLGAMNEAFGHSEPQVYSAHAYDAAYLLGFALSAAVSGGATAPTALDVVAGLRRLQSGEEIRTLPDDILKGMNGLTASADGKIDLVGASGPLDFNQYGEPSVGPIDIWFPDSVTQTFVSTPILDTAGKFVEFVLPTVGGAGE